MPVPSANAMEEFFARQADSRSLTSLCCDVAVWDGLLDSEATREGIQKRFAEMAAAVKADDVVLLYFAGHGKVTIRGGRCFNSLPADGRRRKPSTDGREHGDPRRCLATSSPARRVGQLSSTPVSRVRPSRRSLKVAAVKASVDRQRQTQTPRPRPPITGMAHTSSPRQLPLSYAIGAAGGKSALAETLLAALTSVGRGLDRASG